MLQDALDWSASLEIELNHRGIPFRKFGGMQFADAAHVKDVVGALKWIENPDDRVCGFRTLLLIPGIGPATAEKLLAREPSDDAVSILQRHAPPERARTSWAEFVALMQRLTDHASWPADIELVCNWYRPLLELKYDDGVDRASDLGQLLTIAQRFKSRRQFLIDLTLDPKTTRSALKGADKDDGDGDCLTLATIHAAKGQEWRSVYLLSVIDGQMPSARAKPGPQTEEERRLLYVAMTRARDELTLLVPATRTTWGSSTGDGFGGMLSRRSCFLPDNLLKHFEQVSWGSDED